MLRVVSHPPAAIPFIPPREAAWRADLDAAIVRVPGTEDALKRLHEPGALVVTTGQQPGLFTGPIYTVHKALAAAALARVLERRWKRPVVPIFWIAGDDHDFAEASTASWLNDLGRVVEWHLDPRPSDAPQLSMSSEVLPSDIDIGLRALESDLPAGPLRDDTMAWLRKHYHAGATLHQAYAGAVAELLAPFGVLCFDPTTTAVKRAQAPLLERALTQAGALDQALDALPDPATGIGTGEGATLVFMNTSAGRDRIVTDGEGFRARRSGDRFTREEMIGLLQQEPERFSANVLLRPVVEASLLPTVAYVGGPGEIKYLDRQAFALYPLLGVERQVPVPRWSGSVIGNTSERLLDRLQITVDDVLADRGDLARHFLEQAFPDDARQAIDALKRQLATSGSAIAAAGIRIDPVLDRAISGRIDRLVNRIDDLEAVLLRHLRKRDDIAHAQYQRLLHQLRPNNGLQERVLIAPTYLGRYGNAWTAALFEAASRWAEAAPVAAE